MPEPLGTLLQFQIKVAVDKKCDGRLIELFKKIEWIKINERINYGKTKSS